MTPAPAGVPIFPPIPMHQVGGNAIIAPHNHKFMGIRNGIDMELWSPEENQFLPVNYTSETVVEGKKAARQVGRWAKGAHAA